MTDPRTRGQEGPSREPSKEAIEAAAAVMKTCWPHHNEDDWGDDEHENCGKIAQALDAFRAAGVAEKCPECEVPMQKSMDMYLCYSCPFRLRAESAESKVASLSERVERMTSALQDIGEWRKRALEYDADMGHPIREFLDEDWDQVEKIARAALSSSTGQGGDDAPKAREDGGK